MAKNHSKSFEPCKAFDDYLAKAGCLEDPFSKQILRNYQPCVSTPINSWTIQRTCRSKKRCLSQNLPNIFILQLRRNIPLTTMTLIVFCFGKRALERNAAMFMHWTWGKMSLKGIFFSNFGNLYMLQNNLLLNRGLLTGESPGEVAWPKRLWSGFQ